MKNQIFAAAVALVPTLLAADSTLIDRSALPSQEAYGVATLTPLALSDAGTPSIIVLALEDGDVIPAHATDAGLRYLTVLSGEMSWGDGDTIVQSEEKIYRPGDIITISAGDAHWLAARSGPVAAQLVLLHNESPVPGIQEQMR